MPLCACPPPTAVASLGSVDGVNDWDVWVWVRANSKQSDDVGTYRNAESSALFYFFVSQARKPSVVGCTKWLRRPYTRKRRFDFL